MFRLPCVFILHWNFNRFFFPVRSRWPHHFHSVPIEVFLFDFCMWTLKTKTLKTQFLTSSIMRNRCSLKIRHVLSSNTLRNLLSICSDFRHNSTLKIKFWGYCFQAPMWHWQWIPEYTLKYILAYGARITVQSGERKWNLFSSFFFFSSPPLLSHFVRVTSQITYVSNSTQKVNGWKRRQKTERSDELEYWNIKKCRCQCLAGDVIYDGKLFFAVGNKIKNRLHDIEERTWKKNKSEEEERGEKKRSEKSTMETATACEL